MSTYHMCAFYPRKPEKGAGFPGVTAAKLFTTEPSLELPDTLLNPEVELWPNPCRF